MSSQTVRQWIKDGVYEAERTVGGHYRINYKPKKETVLYARVSSKKQLTSIETQKWLLEERNYGKFVYDIGSGFNFKRRNFVKILEQVMSGTPIKIVVTTPDRLSRSGLTLIVKIIEFYGGEVIFLEDDNKTESFDTATLI